jgi:hypothetical protein
MKGVSTLKGLHIVQQEFQIPTASGSIRLRLISPSLAVDSNDIQVHEEDCWQVLNSQPIVNQPDLHPIRAMTDMIDQQALLPGEICIKGRQWLAIVYDLEADPVCQPIWISLALNNMLSLASSRAIDTVTLPLLGCAHGGLSPIQSLELLLDALCGHEHKNPNSIHLIANAQQLNSLTSYPDKFSRA